MVATRRAIIYGSTFTLTDTSRKIKKGTKGDSFLLGPTLMIVVLTISYCVRDGVMNNVYESYFF